MANGLLSKISAISVSVHRGLRRSKKNRKCSILAAEPSIDSKSVKIALTRLLTRGPGELPSTNQISLGLKGVEKYWLETSVMTRFLLSVVQNL